MRILYAVHGYKPAYRVGGPILSVSALAERMAARGHRVTVVTSDSNLTERLDVPAGRSVNVDGVEVWYCRSEEYMKRWFSVVPYLSRSMGFLYSAEMKQRLNEIVPGVDVVHTHLPFVYPTYAAARSAFRFGKPLFYHQRGVFDPARLKFRGVKKRLYIRAVERPILRRATGLFALTEAEIRSYRALGVDTACHVVPNGIEVAGYRTAPVASQEQRWGIPGDAIVVLFLSRLHPLKGADRLLEAFLRIKDQVPKAVLVLAGPDEWQMETELRMRVQEAEAAGRVIFTGMVEGAEKLDLLARADLFCLPSAGEGFSMAVLEALASSTAVLLSPGCHFPEVESAGAGRVVETDPVSLAAGLRSLLVDRDRLRRMGADGRAFVRREFDWERIVDRILEVYQLALGTASNPSRCATELAVCRHV